MLSLNISLPQLQLFFLVFLRVGAVLMSIPVFDSKSIPLFFKIALAFTTSMALFPLLELEPLALITNFFAMGVSVAGEILLGLVIGFSAKLIFAGIQLAGQLAGYQMGMALANVMDPSSSQQVPLLAQFNNLFALLIFITINAHYWFIRALAHSFQLVPPLNVNFSGSLMEHLIKMSGNMFVIGIQIGAPVIAALLITSVAFGLIARTVPQMNVFIVAMPLKIAVGLLFLGFSLPYFSAFLEKIFNGLGQNIFFMLKAMS
ncbi:MAG: flagellar biosynthetic protein FliR [Deltaproteobacteria bacterium]|nr:flagellar biosynthetic protein FliR [Deltaproteobacteria bacterium]